MPEKSDLVATAGAKEKREGKLNAFLAAYSKLGHVGRACEAVGISHGMIRSAIKKNPEFRDAFDMARQVLADRIEDALKDRAIEGVRKLRFTKDGDVCIDPETGKAYDERTFSDLAAIFLLKGARPEIYKDRFEHTGKDGGALEVKVASLAELVTLASKAKAPKP